MGNRKSSDDTTSVTKAFGRRTKLLMFGLPAAGKNTILHHLGKVGSRSYYANFRTKKVCTPILEIDSWSVGQEDEIWLSAVPYGEQSDAVIFVVDGSDHGSLGSFASMQEQDSTAVSNFHQRLHTETLEGLPLLVFANKQDLRFFIDPSEIASSLGLHLIKDRPWHVAPCCALSKEGLYEGLKWISDVLDPKKKQLRLRDRMVYCDLLALAPLVAFAQANQGSALTDSIFALLPTIINFTGEKTPSDASLRNFSRSAYFDRMGKSRD